MRTAGGILASLITLALMAGLLAVLAIGLSLLQPRPEGPAPAAEPDPEPFAVLVAGGTVIDGTGGPPYQADVGIRGDRIVSVGDLAGHPAGRRIDARGRFVVPGFINPHSHVDATLEEDRDLRSSLQGITTELAGMDGRSALDIAGHLAVVEAGGIGVNYGVFIGHGTVRSAVRGDGAGPAGPAGLRRMAELVRQGMVDGAFGLSTGLEYVPGRYAPTAELVALARVVAEYGGVYVSHIRNERHRVIEAVQEAIQIGREAGVPVVISHIKVARRPHDARGPAELVDHARRVATLIDEARSTGQAVRADVYPYGVPWFLVNRPLAGVYGAYPVETFQLARVTHAEWLDRRVTDLAREWGVSADAAVRRILRADPDARVAVETVDPRVIRLFLGEAFTMISVDAPSGTGAWATPWGPAAHPRAWGTYPRVLGRYVRREGLLSWAQAVLKAAALPARVLGLPRRGLIRAGYYADLVILDPLRVIDRATYAHPRRPPAGIDYVIVNGQVVVERGRLVPAGDDPDGPGLRAGRVLRRDPG